MASEITITTSVSVTKGNYKLSFAPGTQRFDQTAQGAHEPVVSVGTSEEDMAVGDVAVPGWLILQNLDTTNYVTWGPKSGGAMVAIGRIEPGETAVFRMAPSSATLRWLANTAACKVKMILLED